MMGFGEEAGCKRNASFATPTQHLRAGGENGCRILAVVEVKKEISV
jgi:hypothetical protein